MLYKEHTGTELKMVLLAKEENCKRLSLGLTGYFGEKGLHYPHLDHFEQSAWKERICILFFRKPFCHTLN
jgi:hypothetical protein